MSMAVIGVVAIAAPIVSGVITNASMKKQARKQNSKIRAANAEVNRLLENRQDVVDKSQDIRNMESMVSNPYANIGVATQAAEMQAAEADQSLANTLDFMRASGSGAGGATALAQAAAQSKQSVAATIETQEAQNNQLRAQGEQQMQQQLMNIESAAISEEIAAFGRQDARDQAALDRAYGERDFYKSRKMQLQDSGQAALMQGFAGGVSAGADTFSTVRAQNKIPIK
tara:strand:+ start:3346 stop:4029 length:684 start_codon:yes stop_codon:yes gene_type:complete